MRKLVALFFLVSLGICAQELPPIQNFSPLDYDGENQNWAITQGGDNYIYIANNHSLLVYNGEVWSKYVSPNNSSIRSVHAVGTRIFTGQYMEFGYWERDLFGQLKYTSISDALQVPMVEDEEFWNIVTLGDWILFQSLDRIYSYNQTSRQFTFIRAKTTKAHIFKLNGSVYFQDQEKHVFRMENGESVMVLHAQLLDHKTVVGMYDEGDALVVLLENAGFIEVAGTRVKPRNIQSLKSTGDIVVYATARLKDGSYVLGTISDGLYQIGANGNLIRSIDRQNGLNNNTILSVFQDSDENLWLGLDNGISVVNLNSPFNEYLDNSGKLGLVYAAIVFDNALYLGTNQGLFVGQLGSEREFSLIRGTEGQVWNLHAFEGDLLCGHNKGTFLIKGKEARLVSNFPGTWGIKRIPGKPSLLLQGNFDGISVLEKNGSDWSFRNKLEGFDISTRFFEIEEATKVIVNHEIKGIYSLTVDEDFTKVEKVEIHEQMGYGSSLAYYDDKVIYSSINGAFEKQRGSLAFSPYTTFNQLLIDEAGGITSIALPDTKAGRLWYFTKNGLSVITPEVFSDALTITTVPVPSFFRRSLGVAGFENITGIAKDKYLIGISNGFVTLDLSKRKERPHTVGISQIKSSAALEEPVPVVMTGDAAEFASDRNSLFFSYAVPQYEKYAEVSYQYRLKGLFDTWSAWSFQPNVAFSNLESGSYVFDVRAKVGNTLSANIATYAFTVKRPWYLSVTAWICYGLLALGFFFGLHRSYKSYYTKKQQSVLADEKRKLKRKKLKTDKELALLKNEKLKGEIESKNRELAISTMSIIKRNEFLNAIKDQLTKAENATEIKSVIKTIDRSINTDDDWKFFEEAFNNADKNFLKKVKDAHPNLTHNDLRLCAYLRLNLASKEIAPLLNISLRSVEVKRYRLRKKMDLPHESSLTSYLLEL